SRMRHTRFSRQWSADVCSSDLAAYYRDLHPRIQQDFEEYRAFYRRHRNPIERVVMWGYGHYLKANNQPGGKETYNEVVAWLIAFYKKSENEEMRKCDNVEDVKKMELYHIANETQISQLPHYHIVTLPHYDGT